MNSFELTALISTLAIVIADNISDNDDLSLLGTIFTQLGDTLATISTMREKTGNK